MKRIFLIAALTLAFNPAFSFDLTQQLTQIDGKPFIDEKGEKIDSPVSKIIENALLASYNDEQSLTADKKAERFKLAMRITGKKEIDFNSEEVTLIKTLVGKGYPPLVVGQVWKMLDPASMK